MKPGAFWVAATLVAATLVACHHEEDETDSVSPTKPVIAFQGSVDPQFVGRWKTANGRSQLNLGKDGSLQIVSLIASPHGDSTSKVNGQWLASGGELRLRYQAKDSSQTILAYRAEFKGAQLTLTQTGGRLSTVYKRTKGG